MKNIADRDHPYYKAMSKGPVPKNFSKKQSGNAKAGKVGSKPVSPDIQQAADYEGEDKPSLD
jgi:hypothetical protein